MRSLKECSQAVKGNHHKQAGLGVREGGLDFYKDAGLLSSAVGGIERLFASNPNAAKFVASHGSTIGTASVGAGVGAVAGGEDNRVSGALGGALGGAAVGRLFRGSINNMAGKVMQSGAGTPAYTMRTTGATRATTPPPAPAYNMRTTGASRNVTPPPAPATNPVLQPGFTTPNSGFGRGAGNSDLAGTLKDRATNLSNDGYVGRGGSPLPPESPATKAPARTNTGYAMSDHRYRTIADNPSYGGSTPAYTVGRGQ